MSITIVQLKEVRSMIQNDYDVATQQLKLKCNTEQREILEKYKKDRKKDIEKLDKKIANYPLF